jgi:hypothetical protein
VATAGPSSGFGHFLVGCSSVNSPDTVIRDKGGFPSTFRPNWVVDIFLDGSRHSYPQLLSHRPVCLGRGLVRPHLSTPQPCQCQIVAGTMPSNGDYSSSSTKPFQSLQPTQVDCSCLSGSGTGTMVGPCMTCCLPCFLICLSLARLQTLSLKRLEPAFLPLPLDLGSVTNPLSELHIASNTSSWISPGAAGIKGHPECTM